MAHGRALILREGQPAPQEFGNHRPQQNLKNMTTGTTETQQEQGEDDDFPRDPRTGRYQNVFYNYSGTYSTHIWVGGRSIHLGTFGSAKAAAARAALKLAEAQSNIYLRG